MNTAIITRRDFFTAAVASIKAGAKVNHNRGKLMFIHFSAKVGDYDIPKLEADLAGYEAEATAASLKVREVLVGIKAQMGRDLTTEELVSLFNEAHERAAQ